MTCSEEACSEEACSEEGGSCAEACYIGPMLTTPTDQPAKLRYEPSSFRVIRSGRFVPCAVTGEPIALEALRYWSVEHQEAYASCEIATRRLTGQA